ncbi:hypothetical protein Hanom_Chr01g00063371 [Helianthus anomalus]
MFNASSVHRINGSKNLYFIDSQSTGQSRCDKMVGREGFVTGHNGWILAWVGLC